MTHVLRIGALLIAVAGVVDPAIALRRKAPLPVDVRLPQAGDTTHAEAVRLKQSLLELARGSVAEGGSESARAVIAIGNARVEPTGGAPIFVLNPAATAGVSALVATTNDALVGQRQMVSVRFRARGLSGKATEFLLERHGATLGAIQHRWTQENETFDPRFTVPSAGAGVDIVRVVARTAGHAPAAVDVPVAVRSRKVRVLVYEPRPSWAAGFVRQALESDAMFEVTALARTSRGVSTQTAGAPQGLAALDADSVDVVVAGGLDALLDTDLTAIDSFASTRGGTVILVPDGRLPERVRTHLDLSRFEEVLLERPVEVQTGAVNFRASELLLPQLARPEGRAYSSSSAAFRAPATVAHAGAERGVVTAVVRGAGQIVLSGALDAWRFRGEDGGGFNAFWRGLVADVGLTAVPRLGVTVDPMLARAGDSLTVRATLRETEWTRGPGMIESPPVSASMVAADGRMEMIRLWPAAAPGVYEARVAAPGAGRYTVRVEGARSTAESLLVVEASVLAPTPDRTAALARLAGATGGGVFEAGDIQTLVQRLESIDAPQTDYRARPMRSLWWMLPFAGLLSIEWALRRRGGQR